MPDVNVPIVASFSAWHNVEFSTKRNGFGGLDTRLAFNTPLHVRHIENLANMSKQGLFVYKGRGNAADATFVSGECAMVTGSSALYGNIKRNAKFASGISTLPYYPDVPGAPQNTVIGGASLWVLRGRPSAEYRGAARFFAHLSQPEVQSDWHRSTGYLPITQPAYELTRAQGFYQSNPGAELAIKQVTLNPPTDNSKAIRLGSFILIRDVIEDEMELAISGKKSPKDALDDAVKRGNELLRQFERANK